SCRYIKRLKELGITTGYPDGTYRPEASVTRAEMAAFIYRAFLQIETKEGYTNSSGYIEFFSNIANKKLQIFVTDEEGNPLKDVWIKMVADTNQTVIFALDPSGNYFPKFKVIRNSSSFSSSFHSPQVEPITVISLVLTGLTIANFIHEMIVDPPYVDFIDMGNGRGKYCIVGDINDILPLITTGAQIIGGKIIAIKIKDLEKIKWLNFTIKGGISGLSSILSLLKPVEDFLDKPRQICWNTNFIGPDNKPAIIEIDPIEISSVLKEAINPEEVEIRIIGTGEFTGYVADLIAKNKTNDSKYIVIYPGITLKNFTSSERQDLTITKTLHARIEPGEEIVMTITGMCIHLYKDAPEVGDYFAATEEQRQDLIMLGRAIDEYNPSEYVAQEAIWVITDNEPPYFYEEVRRLFILAGLDPDNYEALRSYRALQETNQVKSGKKKRQLYERITQQELK
ncbi:MAG: hypothetical protein DRP29_06540, partial [Thermodesulfobacteriota bacterium]